jgi:hypothetical protein
MRAPLQAMRSALPPAGKSFNDLRHVAGFFTQRRILQARLKVWVRNEGVLILETYNKV